MNPPAAPTLWQGIHDTLAGEIGGGRYAPGAKLPTEAELAQRFGVNRHTVRRALAALAEAAAEARETLAAKAAATRVEFFTLARERA